MANWANIARLGNPATPEWQAENLTWIEPIKGQRWQVYKPAAPSFEGMLNDLIKLGYHPTSSGGYNYRNIRGGNTLSQHAFGTAIDLNAAANAMGQSATDIPDAAELAKKWGLEWGGNWRNRPDPMHFEYTGSASDPVVAQHPPNPTVGTGGYVAPGADTTPVPAATEAQPSMWQNIAKNIGKMGGSPGGTIGDIQPARGGAVAPQAARIDQGETPTIDPQANEMQRQQLAMAMQRLNSGRLF